MKVKGKAKQFFCMACAFVASFLLTVTAFAAVNFDEVNDKQLGKYKCTAISLPNSYIKVYKTSEGYGYCDLFAYWDKDDHQFYSGDSNKDFKLTVSPSEFYAHGTEFTIVNRDGKALGKTGTVADYVATGDYKSGPFRIISRETGHDYVLQK